MAARADRARTVTIRCAARRPRSTAASRATLSTRRTASARVDDARRAVLRDQLLAAQAETRLRIELQPRGIPPVTSYGSSPRSVEARTDAGDGIVSARSSIVSSPKRRPPGRRRLARRGESLRRIQRARSALDPARPRRASPIAGTDEQVARARRRDVGEAHAFRLVARDARARACSSSSRGAQPARLTAQRPRARRRRSAIAVFARGSRVEVGEHHDRELEPLGRCTVMIRTPSVPSSTIGASPRSPRSASSSSRSTKARNEMPPPRLEAARQVARRAARWRAPARPAQREIAACARVASSSSLQLSGDRRRRLRSAVQIARCSVAGSPSASASAVLARARRSRARARRERVQAMRAVADGEASSTSSPSAKSGPRSVANTASSSSGHSIAASAVRSAIDLLALVERAAADQHVRDAARLERAHVRRASRRSPNALEAPEQQAHVARLRPARARPARAPSTVQPLSRTSQSTNAPTASGSDSSIAHFAISCRSRRTAAAPAARRPRAASRVVGATGVERHVRRLAASCVAGHQRRERGVHRAPGSPARRGSSCVRCTSSAPRRDELRACTAS